MRSGCCVLLTLHIGGHGKKFPCTCRLDGYPELLRTAIGSLNVDVPVITRGYNGGKTIDLVKGNATLGWPSIAQIITNDKPSIALVLIGTNDVIVDRDPEVVAVSEGFFSTKQREWCHFLIHENFWSSR